MKIHAQSREIHKREPKGAEREPKDIKMEPKGSQMGTKMRPKIDAWKRSPKKKFPGLSAGPLWSHFWTILACHWAQHGAKDDPQFALFGTMLEKWVEK